MKRGWITSALGGAAMALDVASEAAEAFGPLKAVLGVITKVYTEYEVCSCPLSRNPFLMTHPQETVAVKNKINNLLSRITRLDALFATPACDVVEKGRRDELLQYGIIPHLDLVLILYQQVQGGCEATAVAGGKVKSAAVCRPHSR